MQSTTIVATKDNAAPSRLRRCIAIQRQNGHRQHQGHAARTLVAERHAQRKPQSAASRNRPSAAVAMAAPGAARTRGVSGRLASTAHQRHQPERLEDERKVREPQRPARRSARRRPASPRPCRRTPRRPQGRSASRWSCCARSVAAPDAASLSEASSAARPWATPSAAAAAMGVPQTRPAAAKPRPAASAPRQRRSTAAASASAEAGVAASSTPSPRPSARTPQMVAKTSPNITSAETTGGKGLFNPRMSRATSLLRPYDDDAPPPRKGRSPNSGEPMPALGDDNVTRQYATHLAVDYAPASSEVKERRTWSEGGA